MPLFKPSEIPDNSATVPPVTGCRDGCVASGFDSYPRGLIDRCTVGGRTNIWPIHPDVQQAIQLGKHLNMKAVVRGMRGTGKSTVVSRLCGYVPATRYTPSTGISAGTFFYRSRTSTNTMVECGGAKVELWDVVDDATPSGTSGTVADMHTVDVYRGCHVALFVIDRRRKESLEYVVREAPHVPPTTCIVIVINFRDAPRESLVVSERDVSAVCKSLRRTTTPMVLAVSGGRPPPECYSTSAIFVSISAVTGDGMESLWDAFETPFLLVKVLSLEGEINSCFQHIERHSTRTLDESARRQLHEKEELRRLRKEREMGETRSGHNPHRGGCAPPTPRREVLSLTHATTRGCGDVVCEEEDVEENGIAKGFFDDLEGDETCEECFGDVGGHIGVQSSEAAADDEAETLSSSHNASCVRRLPSPAVAAAASLLRRDKAVAGDSLTSIGGYTDSFHANMPRTSNLEGITFDGRGGGFSLGEAVTLDDGFFSVGGDEEEEELRLTDEESLAGNGSDADESLPPRTRIQLKEPVSVNSLPGAEQSAVMTSSMKANIDVLLREMQSVLLTSTGSKPKSRPERSSRQRSNRDRKNRELRRRRAHGAAECGEKKEIHCDKYDDGTFEVIRD
ncbi:hypothetical protein DPX39_100092700 [Trypanosoma brucei equiperdum]|uniref:Uncharacterized protein n=1 Tax=Trypanosoma brucei equiperdum TaxID=630700 RepID=A0A3L6KYU0_9TRYP|nr:hypothetical protein DPX39_100092700 [Trypanosoma brucei equiperdum]